jgi:O-antigen/teichoic acid export membrane protein
MSKRLNGFNVRTSDGFLARVLSGGTARVLVETFAARAITAAGALVLAVVVGRLAGGDAFGVFSFFNTLLIGAAIVARWGTDRALIRFGGSSSRDAPHDAGIFLRLAVLRTFRWSFFLSLGIMCLVFLSSDVANSPFASKSAAIWTAVALIPFSLSMVLSGFLKGVLKPIAGTFQENGLVSMCAAVMIIIVQIVEGKIGLPDVFACYAVSAWGVLVIGAWQALRWKAGNAGEKYTNKSALTADQLDDFKTSSAHYAHMTLVVFLQSFVVVMLLGFLMTPVDLGAYKAGEKLTIAIVFIMVVINSVFAPRLSRAYSSNNGSELKRLFGASIALGACAALVPYIIMIVYPSFVMGAIAKEYSEYGVLLVILATAQFINVLFGPVATLLNMCGQERFVKSVLVLVSLLCLAIYPLGVFWGGALGVAIAYGLSVVLQNGLCAIRVRQVLSTVTERGDMR